MDFSNQLSIFNPEKYENKSVCIVGVGSIGSFVGIVLSKMGIANLELYDGDTIEEHNIPNQFYKLKQIKKRKTEALKEIIKEFSDIKNVEVFGKVDKKTILASDVVIVCTDSMKSRKLAYNQSKKLSNYLIDARMNGHTYRIYTVDLQDKNERKEYEKTLYSDKESDKGLCTEKTVVYNVAEVASKIGNQIRKIMNDEDYSHMLAYDFKNDYLIKKRWKK